MQKDNYNWWDDPKNEEEIKRISWWEHPISKKFFDFPISAVESDGYWVVACNSDTEKLIGNGLSVSAQGKTKEEALKKMFMMIALTHDYSEECRLNYQRWVPFRKGDWKHSGGTWFIIFGIQFYFRHGNGMKGGVYIPFTKLNISISNDWITYRNWKLNKKNEQNKN